MPFVWTVTGNTHSQKFGCRRIITVEKAIFEDRIFGIIASAPNDPKITLYAKK